MADESQFNDKLAAAVALVGNRSPGTTQDEEFMVVPDGYHLKSIEEFRLAPLRKSGLVVLDDAPSLSAYVKAHALSGTHIYAHYGKLGELSVAAVLNDHSKEQAGHGDYRALFVPLAATEWKDWIAFATTPMHAQDQFAAFIEDHIPDIVKPDGADLLEMVTALEITKKVSFTSALRLSSGYTQISYTEQGGARGSSVKVPEMIDLAIPVFAHGDKVRLTARLRYTIDNEYKLKLGVRLIRPDLAHRAACDTTIKAVEVGTGLVVLRGEPRKV